jgi:hypothetical protein
MKSTSSARQILRAHAVVAHAGVVETADHPARARWSTVNESFERPFEPWEGREQQFGDVTARGELPDYLTEIFKGARL